MPENTEKVFTRTITVGQKFTVVTSMGFSKISAVALTGTLRVRGTNAVDGTESNNIDLAAGTPYTYIAAEGKNIEFLRIDAIGGSVIITAGA